MINGVIFKIKPYEDKKHKIWLNNVNINGFVDIRAVPLTDDEERYNSLEYNQLQFVYYKVREIRANGSVKMEIRDILRINVDKDGKDTPIFVTTRENAYIPLIRTVLKGLREGHYGQGTD